MPPNDLLQQPLSLRCLALTGTFETNCLPPDCFGTVAGDFDGQGISFSALQWNFGQGTLQPLLAEMNSSHAGLMSNLFGDGHPLLTAALAGNRPQQMSWVRAIQTSKRTLQEPWAARFRSLGLTAEFQCLATRHAAHLFDSAIQLCRTLGLHSERAAALLFDIEVQNGGLGSHALTLIEKDFAALHADSGDSVEIAKMCTIANKVADSSNPRWREDVRTRKLAIAKGEGLVHGMRYDLAAQFGLTLAGWNLG
jgi:hypothetical protein